MSSKSTSATQRSNTTFSSRRRTETANRHLTSEVIAADIAAFKREGGHIEVLGNTPYRAHVASTTFRSDANAKREPTTASAAKSTVRN